LAPNSLFILYIRQSKAANKLCFGLVNCCHLDYRYLKLWTKFGKFSRRKESNLILAAIAVLLWIPKRYTEHLFIVFFRWLPLLTVFTA